MSEFQAKVVENFTVDPITGDITFTRPDGTTYRMIRDPVSGTYRIEQGADSVPSDMDEFMQSALNAALAAVNGQSDNIKVLESLLSTLGENAQAEYLKDLQRSYQAYADALSAGADKAQATAEQWQSIVDGMKKNYGLRDNLSASAQQLFDKAVSSAERAGKYNELAAGAKSELSAIEARFSNLGAVLDFLQLAQALSDGSTNAVAKAAFGVAAGMIAGAFVGGPIAVGIFAGFLVGFAADWLYEKFLSDYFKDAGNFWDNLFDALGLNPLDKGIEAAANGINHNSTYRIERYDPLALDLDGDGKITTSAESNWAGALFDNDGDGIRTASGWIGSNDGLLVRDLDGNGAIDNGRELFGDQTVLRNGQHAATGFEALADLDSNGDGVIDASDEAFASLRIWRDRNGDGISQAGELSTLDELGIVSLSLAHASANTSVDGGAVVGIGSYTRRNDDGTLATQVMQDFEFDNDALHSKFGDAIDIPPELQSLASMQGMGALRDLREACALSPELTQLVRDFSAAPTRNVQQALLSDILLAWANTSPLWSNQGVTLHASGAIESASSDNVIRLTPSQKVDQTVTALFPNNVAQSALA